MTDTLKFECDKLVVRVMDLGIQWFCDTSNDDSSEMFQNCIRDVQNDLIVLIGDPNITSYPNTKNDVIAYIDANISRLFKIAMNIILRRDTKHKYTTNRRFNAIRNIGICPWKGINIAIDRDLYLYFWNVDAYTKEFQMSTSNGSEDKDG